MWFIVMRVFMGNEWLEVQQMGVFGFGGRGGVCVCDMGKEGGFYCKEIEGEDIQKYYIIYIVIIFLYV